MHVLSLNADNQLIRLLIIVPRFLWYAWPANGRIMIEVFNQDVTVPRVQFADGIAELVELSVLRISSICAIIVHGSVQITCLLTQAMILVITDHDGGGYIGLHV
ncbi:MAG: hypothetical protein EBR82_59915 [Caulobacteraceae bacterium]|nr:hypothetical protein [Caulobacteraceae bacterium]